MDTTESSAIQRSIHQETRSGDPIYAAGTQAQEDLPDLYRAAAAAMRLLQDRQQHMPQDLLDHREAGVLRQLRSAIRNHS